MKLTDRLQEIVAALPPDWETARLTLTTEQPSDLARAAQMLGSMGAGRSGESLVLELRRAGGPSGPEGARRLFARLDEERLWCELVPTGPATRAVPRPVADSRPLADAWIHALAELPSDWSHLLCELELGSSALLPRAALLCAPINPTRAKTHVGFTFRCATHAGYGASPQMVRRCFERLDTEEISGGVRVLRVMSDAGLVATQGPVWVVDGKMV
jgi:hypothetical protein